MELSHYVYECQGWLLNLTNKVTLPIDVTEQDLRSHHFLKGQERDAIDQALFGHPHSRCLSLKITPTWRCNLRCKHCFVLEKLTTRQKSRLDVDQVMTFVANYHNHFRDSLEWIACCLVGGEVTMETGKCLELTERLIVYGREQELPVRLAITTNGINFDLDILELMNRCQTITFSVDGVKESHNWQRKAAVSDLVGVDLYERTVDNIRRAVKLGLRDQISVQASLMDAHCQPELIREFFHEMVRAGVHPTNIKVGTVCPTSTNPIASDRFRTYMANHVAGNPCCKWRIGREFIIDENNTLFCDYFDELQESALGALIDPIPELLYKHEQIVRDTMPILGDPKCLSCPVIGACWGRCCNVSKVQKPSEICDQDGLKKVVMEEAASGNLLNLLRVNKGDCGGNP